MTNPRSSDVPLSGDAVRPMKSAVKSFLDVFETKSFVQELFESP